MVINSNTNNNINTNNDINNHEISYSVCNVVIDNNEYYDPNYFQSGIVNDPNKSQLIFSSIICNVICIIIFGSFVGINYHYSDMNTVTVFFLIALVFCIICFLSNIIQSGNNIASLTVDHSNKTRPCFSKNKNMIITD